MRLVAVIVVVCGLAAVTAWVPIAGETLWHRAEQRGLPNTAAHAMGTAARTVGNAATGAWRWANAPGPGKSVRRPAEGERTTGARPESHKALAHAVQPRTEGQHQEGRGAPLALPAAPPEVRKVAAAPAAAPRPHDGIAPAAAPEQLSEGDRAALDKLVGSASTR